MQLILQNILLGISLAAPLGPSGIAVIKNGIQKGFFKAFLTAIGVVSADATYLLVVFLGLSQLIVNPFIKVTIWTFGAIVLVYLGYQSIKEFWKLESIDADIKSEKNAIVTGYLINISNPLAVVWWLGVFGSILGSTDVTSSRLIALIQSSTILIGILMWHLSMATITHFSKKIISVKVVRMISLIAGIALIGFGLKFGYNAFTQIMEGGIL